MITYAVYTLCGEDGHPLYIGCTNNLPKRTKQHQAKSWWPEVRSVTWEYVEGKDAALARERSLIEASAPVHNVAYVRPGWSDGGWPGRRASQIALHLTGAPCHEHWCKHGCRQQYRGESPSAAVVAGRHAAALAALQNTA